jgi:hypothetical protein
MQVTTFGFMDSARGEKVNSELFIQLRACAIQSFEVERVCNLHSFEGDSIEACETFLAKEDGAFVGGLRDFYYHQGPPSIRFPDLQSYFLYAFTLGVNKFSWVLLDPKDLPEVVPPVGEEILARHFPVNGPRWLTDAMNSEMPYLENVFCDFQDKILVPIGRDSGDARLFADVFAGSLLWAYWGGKYWFREVIAQISGASRFASSPRQMEGVHQVKRRMLFVDEEECAKALAAQDLFDEDGGEEDGGKKIGCCYCGETGDCEHRLALKRDKALRRDIPKGKFRVILTDEFPVPPEDCLRGDYDTLKKAKEHCKPIQPMTSYEVYDDRGKRVFYQEPVDSR